MSHVKGLLLGIFVACMANLAPAMARDFTLEGYFTGRTSADGSFSAINGVKRTFKVDLHGTWRGKTLTLVEDFIYDDGERDRKTWRFHKTGPGRYSGTRDDVIGETQVTITGDTARFTYLVYLDARKKKNKVRFHDTMRLQGDETLVNTASITKFGFPVAKTRVVFRRH